MALQPYNLLANVHFLIIKHEFLKIVQERVLVGMLTNLFKTELVVHIKLNKCYITLYKIREVKELDDNAR